MSTTPNGQQLVSLSDDTHTAAVLRLRSAVPHGHENTRRAGRALVDVLRRLDDLVLVSFRVASRAGVLHAGVVVESFDDESSAASAERLGVAVDALAPWLEWELGRLDGDDPLALPSSPQWASRVLKGDVADELVRAGDFSPLAVAMSRQDSVLSVALAGSAGDPSELLSDIVLASTDQPTDVLASLLTTELNAESNIGIETAHGEDARRMVAAHRHPTVELQLGTFSDVFSLPVRADVDTSWRVQPVRPRPAEPVLNAFLSAPHLPRLVIGKTGVGKTTLLEHAVLHDIAAGKAIVVIDPHGAFADRVKAIAGELAPERLQWVDFGAPEPPRYNPLLAAPGQSVGSLVAGVLETLRTLWDDCPPDFFGPVFTRAMSFCVETLVRYQDPPRISDLVRLIQGDEELIRDLAERARYAGDPSVARTFLHEVSNLGVASRDGGVSNMTVFLLSKFDAMVSDERVRVIVDTDRNDISMTETVERRLVTVMRVPVGELGLAAVRALVQPQVNELNHAIGRRFEHRAPTESSAFYCDEWHLIAQSPICRMLAEGRKYGLEMTLANQSVHQIAEPMTVLGNVGTLAAFRMGPADASMFAPEFASMDAADLRLLPPFQVAVRPPFLDEVVGHAPAPLELPA